MENTTTGSYVLGLDIGAESVGWAVIRKQQPDDRKLISLGSHRFDAGVEGDMESGRDESRATVRREARQPRRQHWRRAWRKRKLLRILQYHHLLPSCSVDSPAEIHDMILALDTSIRDKYKSEEASQHLLPYLLRRKALDSQLEPYEFGRAVYHLAQRRGFLSNRKTSAGDSEEGVVKAGIGKLHEEMAQAQARTLGEYFASLNPLDEVVRRRWTSRQMFIDEFDMIWSAQLKHHSQLTDDTRTRIHDAIFDQRPLKSQQHLIGKCELIKDKHGKPIYQRASLALRIAQRFRMLQKINDLVIHFPDHTSRKLNETERRLLFEVLDRDGDKTFIALKGKACLKLPKGTTFNFEEGGEKKLIGHRTDAKLSKIFGARWLDLSEVQRDAIVEDVRSFEKSESLIRRARQVWDLDVDQAKELAEVNLEPGHTSHSRQALARLVERMKDGTPYQTARQIEFPESFESKELLDKLPPVLTAISDLRNPAVCRALTELRKLVNQLIEEHGKPDVIRIELARDLKRPRKQRQEASKRMRANEKQREKAIARILDESDISVPKNSDIQKVLLADECGWECPYTGQQICMRTLIGQNPQFDFEHIWPMSRSLDNTFFNKTLCYHEENRTRKGNLTPHEAYSQNEARWEQIIERVKRFQGNGAREKLRRFMAEEIPENMQPLRHLQDTRYTSRLAADYLGLLYGGRIDKNGRKRIQTNTGGITSILRREWQLGPKSRDTHLHHAEDAVLIALSSTDIVEKLSHAAAHAYEHRRKLFAPIQHPWSGFENDLHEAINHVRVSMRVSRKLNGVLHAETLYSKPINVNDKKSVRHVRKQLHKLSVREITGNAIVDPIKRDIIQKAFSSAEGKNPAIVFADPAYHPYQDTHDGRRVPIHKIRVKASVTTWDIGEGPRRRHVAPKAGSNHHTVIVAELDEQGNETKWTDHPVSRFEVMQRRRRGEPIVQRDWGDNRRFKFSLSGNECLEMQDNDGNIEIYRVAGISKGNMEMIAHWDARTKIKRQENKIRIQASTKLIFGRKARKVRVTYLGCVVPAND